MKTNSLATTKKWDCKFDMASLIKLILLIQVCFLAVTGYSQEFKKTFSKEIEVSKDLSVHSNAPTSFNMEMHVHRSTQNNTYFGYSILGKEGIDRLVVHKEYAVDTWDKNVVRQEVDITLRTEDQQAGQALMDALQIELSQNMAGQVHVDANMNIEKFTMRNGRFRGDDCRIILKGGKKYKIEYLELKTRLYIPKTANLKVQSELNHTLLLSDLDGDLDLDLQYSEVFGKKVKNLNANLYFCYNVIFDEVQNVVASATNSHLKIGKVKNLNLGQLKLGREPDLIESIAGLQNNSSMNIYDFRQVDEVIVFDTANDEFKLGEVNDLKVEASVFSNYRILKLNKILDFSGKSGDLLIAELNKDFEKVDIKNSHSKLNINIAEDSNFNLNIIDKKLIDLKLPSNNILLNKTMGTTLRYKIGKDSPTGQIIIRCDKCELDIWD